jgi:formylglycine-generating enzyme required for sulfatase activity
LLDHFQAWEEFMAHIEKTVFISYRRKDISWALAVYQYLTAQKFDVFFDYTSLSSGDFEAVIVSNIRARAHFVLILTPTALDRCSEPGDWLRREIETAVDENRNIIPLFFDGFSFGTPGVAGKLTGKLSAVNRYNGLEVPPGYFLEAMERLKNRYLNIPLDAVIRPVPTQVRKVVQETQEAANRAVEEQREDIEKLVKPAEDKESVAIEASSKGADGPPPEKGSGRQEIRPNSRFYGMAVGVLLILVLVTMSIVQWLRSPSQEGAALTEAPLTVAPATEGLATIPQVTERQIPVSPPPLALETVSPQPSPTLGVGSTRESEKDGMTLLYVPEGDFRMGGTGVDEKPIHTVFLSAFWIDRTEVTNAMYQKCVEEKGCKESGNLNRYNNSQYSNHPVTNVTWEMANAYCTWAGRRLPTEAQWEKAAVGEIQPGSLYPWGNEIDCSKANYQGKKGNTYCEGDTAEVTANQDGMSPYGALNMAGNVWEWVSDWYNVDYYKLNLPWSDPLGPESGREKVIRGGAWNMPGAEVRSTNRGKSNPNNSSNSIGFRCAYPG